MLGKPDRGCVDGPLSSPPCIFHFFLVLSKTIQALTQPLQPDGGQLQKELSLKTGHILGGNSISHGRYDFLNTACSPTWGPLLGAPPLLSLQQISSLTTDTQTHAHTLMCAHTHKVHTCTQGTHRHTRTHTFTPRCTRAHKVGTGTQGHTHSHTDAHGHTK